MRYPHRRRISHARPALSTPRQWVFEDRLVLSWFAPVDLLPIPAATDLVTSVASGASAVYHTIVGAVVAEPSTPEELDFDDHANSALSPLVEALSSLEGGGPNDWLWSGNDPPDLVGQVEERLSAVLGQPDTLLAAKTGGESVVSLFVEIGGDTLLTTDLVLSLPGLATVDARVELADALGTDLGLVVEPVAAELAVGVETDPNFTEILARSGDREPRELLPTVVDLGLAVDTPILAVNAGIDLGGVTNGPRSTIIDLGLAVTTPIVVIDAALEVGGPPASSFLPGVLPSIGVDLGVEVGIGDTPIIVVDAGVDGVGQPIPWVVDLPDVVSPSDPFGASPGTQGPGETPIQAEGNPGEIVSPPADQGATNTSQHKEAVGHDKLEDGVTTTPSRPRPGAGLPSPAGSRGLATNFPQPSIPFLSHDAVGEVASTIGLVEPEFVSGDLHGWAIPSLASLMAGGPAAASFELADLAGSMFGTAQAMDVVGLVASGHGSEDLATAGALASESGPVILATASAVGSAWPEVATIKETACAAVLQSAHEQLSQALDSIERMIDGLFNRSKGFSLIEGMTALGLTAYAASRLARLRQGETRRLALDGIPFHRRGPGPFCRGQDDLM